MFKICRQAFCEKSDYINENVSIESRRNERVESLKDSNILDCHEAFTSRNDDRCGLPRKSCGFSRNDGAGAFLWICKYK